MHKHHNYKNRAPKKGSSAFFTSKRERDTNHYNEMFDANPENKYKRPARASRRKYGNKDKESKSFKYSLLVKDYEDLIKFKTFVTFLRKKADKKMRVNIQDEQLLRHESFETTMEDLKSVQEINQMRGLFNSLTYLATKIETWLGVELSFTNKKITIAVSKRIATKDAGMPDVWLAAYPRRGAMLHSYNEHEDMPTYVDLTNSTEPITTHLKSILHSMNRNIKHPTYNF